MTENSGPAIDGIEIVRLAATFEGFGLVVDYLSRSQPFVDFELGNFCGVVRMQLQQGHHLAAMHGPVMVGYAGWMRTTQQAAEDWMEDSGILHPIDPELSDAAALTVFAATDSRATPRLIRGARELNPNVRVFFKRGCDGDARGAKKASVLNFTSRP